MDTHNTDWTDLHGSFESFQEEMSIERKQAFSGRHADLTDKILKAFFKIYYTLGYGFAERVYENALVIELKKSGLQVENWKIFDNDRKGALTWHQRQTNP